MAGMPGLRLRSASSQTACPEATGGGRVKKPDREDYVRALRRHFSRAEILEFIAEGRKRVWPGLNRDPFRLVTADQFVKQWSPLGVDFRLAKLSWRDGLELLGFYVKKQKGLCPRPLICVNTAHHPALVGITFAHEMGHHLTSQMFAPRSTRARAFPFNSGYAKHMYDARELAADILVSVGMYPQTEAYELFSNCGRNAPRKPVGHELTDALPVRAHQFLARHYLRFNGNLSIDRKALCKAGLTHYTILRQALLEGFDL